MFLTLPARLAPMRPLASLALLALLAGAPVPLLTQPAFAADALPATGLVDVLPVGEIVGDGQTESLVHAVLRLPTGAPVTGVKLKVTTTAGTVSDVVELGDGVYVARLVAPAVTAPSTLTVSFKGRVDALGAVEAKRELPVSPAFRGTLTVTSGQPALVLGTDNETTLSISFPAGIEAPTDPRDVLVRVSSGAIASLVPLGGGRFTARYVAPTVNYPHLSMITVSDRRAPADIWGVGVIALQGRVDYPVTARPGANVILKVGGREFGPVGADASGRASVPIVVPPGVGTAVQITADATGVTEGALDLRVPGARRLSLFDAPPNVPSDARVSVPVRVVVRKADGAPDPDAMPTLTATAGRISEARHAGNGVFVATYTPPDGRSAITATIQATLGDTTQSDSIDIALVPGMPSTVEVSAEPSALAVGATALKVYTSLKAADGTGLTGRSIRFTAAGAAFKTVTDLKGGDYRADFSANPASDALVRVVAVPAPSENALRHVIVLPSRSAVKPGERQVVTVITTDAFGYAVPNVTVELGVLGAQGSLPATVTTDAQGVADVIYEAGATSGLTHVEAKAGAARGASSFWQADLQAPGLPTSGSLGARTVAQTWRSAITEVYVEREGGADAPLVELATSVPMAGAVAASDLASEAASGEIASLAAVPAAAQIPPGGSVDLLVRVQNGAGAGVEGAVLEAFATGGARVSTFTPLGGGNYKATITAPADASGTVKVNVQADGGAALTTVEIPVGGEAVVAEPTKPEKEPKEAVEPWDRPSARLRVGFLVGTYQYEQSPSEDPGELLPQSIGWGGERGGAPTPVGFEAGFRGFLPMAKWVGLDAAFRYSRYEVSSANFSNPAVDNLFALRASLIGRAPIKVGRDEIAIGARVGFRWDDFITFRGRTDPGSTVSYEPLGLAGLDVGLDLGAEFWKMYLTAAGSAGLANGSVPYAGNADVHLGWNVVKWFFIDLGFGYQYRSLEIEGADSGVVRATLQDQQILGTVGVGASF